MKKGYPCRDDITYGFVEQLEQIFRANDLKKSMGVIPGHKAG